MMSEPASRELWNQQYTNNRWAYLHDIEQFPRYALIGALCDKLHPAAKVLDIGCGEGILLSWLHLCKQYVGIDLSGVAIEKAIARHGPDQRGRFICSSAESYCHSSDEKFDIIVFNEVLYYFEDAVEAISSYACRLVDTGYFLISVSGFEPKTWNVVKEFFGHSFVMEANVEERTVNKTWNIAVARNSMRKN